MQFRSLGCVAVLALLITSAFAWGQCPDPAVPCDIAAPGDFDGDGDVDMDDFAILQGCANRGSETSGCDNLDLNGDGRNDETDFGIWQSLYTGACSCGPNLREPPQPAPAEPSVRKTPVAPPVLPDSKAAHSIYLATGEFYLTAEDLRLKGRGLDLVWARKYRSRLGPHTAMGQGWDFSYNIRLAKAGQHMRVFDGNTRADVYYRRPDGTWSRPEFFRVLAPTEDGAYALVFPDTGRWIFRPLDGSPASGRIAQIADRNGNSLTFTYDDNGRLVQINDTLGRPFTIAYDETGYISSVTDFTGRRITYAYYRDGDEDGGDGDLKSVSGPAAADIAPSSPQRVVTYTYSRGNRDDRLNHNLLTITDARGQLFLRNIYGEQPDGSDVLEFDRVLRQVWGNPGDNIDIVYVPQRPSPESNYATVKTIINDRVGNVHEYGYDARHRLVIARDYTGRADPDEPTTETANRPINRLRPDDPESFTTWFEYNSDSLCTRVIYPNGNEHLFAYDYTPDNPRARGNLLRHVQLAGPLGGDQQRIVQSWEYDSSACCGTNSVTRWVDARGGETLHTYDPQGNCLRTQHRIPSAVEEYEYNAAGQMTAHIWPDNGSGYRRRDTFIYYESGPQNGYLQSEVIDTDGLELTTVYEYDALGRCTRKISPRGFDTLYIYDAMDRVTRELSPPMSSEGGRPQRSNEYDLNGNLVRVDIHNLDERGRVPENDLLSTWYDYDVLNRTIRKVEEIDSQRAAVTEYEYDANGNLTLTRSGEAVSGRQPANTTRTIYDERGLPFRVIRAEGDPAQTTTQYDYDGNGNCKRVRAGIEATPRQTVNVYDGFNRLIRETDAMGNTKLTRYDSGGNIVLRRTEGELNDAPGDAGNVRLYEESLNYDALGRLVRKSVAFFDPRNQAAIGKGQAVTRYEYSDASQLKLLVDDNGNAWSYSYDTAGRRRTVTDPAGNVTTSDYDADSNLVRTVEVRKSDFGEVTVATSYEHTPGGKLFARNDGAGNTETWGYDARGLQVLHVDARGVETRRLYDGMGRLISIVTDMNQNGASPDDPQDIVVSQAWDDASRLIARTDGNRNTTRYEYDAADRLTSVVYADSTAHTFSLDVHGNAVVTTDPNGSIVTATYDLLGRLIRRSVKPAPGIGGTTKESYGYDGLSRVASAVNDDSAVSIGYDSMSNVVREAQQVVPAGPTRVTTSGYDGVGNCVRLVYPNGRVIVTSYDGLNQPSVIHDATPGGPAEVAAYKYIGRKVASCEFGNGTRAEIAYSQDLPSGVQHVTRSDGARLEHQVYSWDPAGNLVRQQRLLVSPAEVLTRAYDAANRLATTEITPGGAVIRYALDAAGNRLQVDGGPDAATFVMDGAVPEPADLQMNQYTAVAGRQRIHDRNGNLKSSDDRLRRYSYDFRNRLIEFIDIRANLTVLYKYDCFGRRIEKNAGGVITRYYYTGRLNIEEQNQSHITSASYIYGPRLTPSERAVLQVVRPGQRYFLHADGIGNCVRLSKASGEVIEQYLYSDYGRVSFYNSAGASIPGSAAGNPWLFAGMRLDTESGLHFDGVRYLDPAVGRYLTRDPAGVWADAANCGNPYLYSANNPMRPWK